MFTLKFLSATSVRRLQAQSFLYCNQITSFRQLPWRPLSVQYSVNSLPEDAASRLSTKKCIPCNSDLRPMEEDNAVLLMEKVPGWNIVKDEGPLKLARSWKVKNFVKGIEFFHIIAKVAEAEVWMLWNRLEHRCFLVYKL